MDMSSLDVAERIRNLRLERNLTQLQLARRIGVSTGTVSSYENSETNPPLDTLIKICKVFNVSADFLLGINDARGEQDMTGMVSITLLTRGQRRIVLQLISEFENTNTK